MDVIEWPKGHRLFSESGFHMSFDPPEGTSTPAILFKKVGRDTLLILSVEVFESDDAALEWFSKQLRRHLFN